MRFVYGHVKGRPEPPENKIHEILCSKREDRFSDPFFDLVQNISLVCISYLLCLCNFCKALWDMRKFPQKCQKIAGCKECSVYGSRPPIASIPLIPSGTTRSRQYHESTMVRRNFPLYHLLKSLLPLCHALFVRKDKTKY